MVTVPMEFTLVPEDLLTKHENHQGNVISLEREGGKRGGKKPERPVTRPTISVSPWLTALLHTVPLARAKLEALLLLRGSDGISSCCLPQRLTFLGAACRGSGSHSDAPLYG